jgi:hypothetical protein
MSLIKTILISLGLIALMNCKTFYLRSDNVMTKNKDIFNGNNDIEQDNFD